MHKARVNKWVVMFIANWPRGQGFIIPPGDCDPPEIVYTWSGNSGQIHRLTWGLWSTGICLKLVRNLWTDSSSHMGTLVHWKLLYLVRKMWTDSPSHLGKQRSQTLFLWAKTSKTVIFRINDQSWSQCHWPWSFEMPNDRLGSFGPLRFKRPIGWLVCVCGGGGGGRQFVGRPAGLTYRKVRYIRIQSLERKIIISFIVIYRICKIKTKWWTNGTLGNQQQLRLYLSSRPPSRLSFPNVLPNSIFLAELIIHSSHSTLSILWSICPIYPSIISSRIPTCDNTKSITCLFPCQIWSSIKRASLFEQGKCPKGNESDI